MNAMVFPDYVLDCTMHAHDTKCGVIKRKLSEILEARLSGDTEAELDSFFDISFPSARTFTGNPEWILNESVPGWHYNHIAGYTQDFCGFEHEIWESSGYYCHAAMWLEVIRSGFFNDFFNGSYDKLSLEEKIDELCAYSGMEFSDEDPDRDAAEAVISSMEMLRKGKSSSLLDEFLQGLSALYEDAFSLDFLYDNLTYFCESLVWSSCDYPIYTIVIYSSEIYAYRKYREKVPEDIRKNVDNAFEIFINPVDFANLVLEDRAEEKSTTVAFQIYDDPSENMSHEDMHPLYTAALRYLIKILPELRKEYGDAL